MLTTQGRVLHGTPATVREVWTHAILSKLAELGITSEYNGLWNLSGWEFCGHFGGSVYCPGTFRHMDALESRGDHSTYCAIVCPTIMNQMQLLEYKAARKTIYTVYDIKCYTLIMEEEAKDECLDLLKLKHLSYFLRLQSFALNFLSGLLYCIQ